MTHFDASGVKFLLGSMFKEQQIWNTFTLHLWNNQHNLNQRKKRWGNCHVKRES